MNFKQAQLDKYLKTPDKNFKCFLIYGSNEGLVATITTQLIKTVAKDVFDPFSVAYINYDDVAKDISILASEYCSQSLMGDRRVVVVKDVDNNLTKNLKNIIDSKSDTLLILTSASLNTKSSLVSFCNNEDSCACIACYEDRSEDIYSLVKSKLVENGYTINHDALDLLCSRLSNDRLSSLCEIEKLLTYMGAKKNISLENVFACVSDVGNSSSEDICYFVAEGFSDKAQKAYERMINEGADSASIIRNLTYHFYKLMLACGHIENGDSVDTALSKLYPRLMFFRISSFKNQLRAWNKTKLLMVMDLLYKTERECRTTNMPNDEIVSYTLMQISKAYNKRI